MQQTDQKTSYPESCDPKGLSKVLLNLGIAVAFIVILVSIYFPAIDIPFLFSDDYSMVQSSATQEPTSLIKTLRTTSSEGKFIYGFFLYAISNTIEYPGLIRLFGVIGLGILAFILYSIMDLYRVRREHAFLASVLVCMIPSFQLFVNWLVCVPYIFSVTLSFIAGILSLKFASDNSKSLRYRLVSFILSIALFIISIHINQPSAITYWAAGVIPLASLRNEDLTDKWQNPFISFFSAGFISLGLYYVSVKAILFIMDIGLVGRGSFVELSNIPLKLKWFLCCPIVYALNLWNLFPTYTRAGIAGIVIAGLLVPNFIQAFRSKKRTDLLRSNCLRTFFIAAVIFMGYLPNLMVTSTEPASRTLVSITMAIALLSFFGFMNLIGSLKFLSGSKNIVITISLVCLTLITAYQTHNNVRDFAMLQVNEVTYVKNVITEYGIQRLSGISGIYMRKPDDNELIKKGFLYDDSLGRPTSTEWREGENLVKVVLQDLGVKEPIKITVAAADIPLPDLDNMLFIDMTKFDFLSSVESSITGPQSFCITIPKRL